MAWQSFANQDVAKEQVGATIVAKLDVVADEVGVTITGGDVLSVYEGEVAYFRNDAATPYDAVDVHTSHIHEKDDWFESDADYDSVEESAVNSAQQCDAIDLINDANLNPFIGAYASNRDTA